MAILPLARTLTRATGEGVSDLSRSDLLVSARVLSAGVFGSAIQAMLWFKTMPLQRVQPVTPPLSSAPPRRLQCLPDPLSAQRTWSQLDETRQALKRER